MRYVYILVFIYCFILFYFIFPKKKTYEYSIVLQLHFLLTDFHI